MSIAESVPGHPWQGVWRLVDPKITLASVASMVLGLGLAAHDGPIHWGWLALTVFGIFCVEAAKNASGEVFDWDSGDDQAVAPEDKSPFSGGKRVLVDGLLSRAQTWAVAFVCYGLGAAAGLVIAAYEPRVLWLGLVGMALAYFYHAPPLKLSYRGLGEVAVALAYGPVILCGTYLVQRHHIPLRAVIASIPLGLAIACFLWVSEFPDLRADAAAGKRTLVVRLGRERASRVFAVLVGAAYVALALSPLGGLPKSIWLGFAGLPLAIVAARKLLAARYTAEVVPAQVLTLLSFVGMAVFGAVGLIFL